MKVAFYALPLLLCLAACAPKAEEPAGGFTGVTVGPYCQNGSARIEYFDYEEN